MSLPCRPLWKPAWKRRAAALGLPALFLVGFAGRVPLAAQVQLQPTNTVRGNEFRSRWANYQVDRPAATAPTPDPADPNATAANATAEQPGFLASFGKTLDDLFRKGPIQVRANLAAGWEFSDEDNLRLFNPNGSDNSPFIAPAFGLFYNQERGPLTISARYSFGYVYYLDQDYYGANRNGGILSHTAGLDLSLEGKRSTFTSSTGLSYGNGNDIESGQQRDLLSLNESLLGTYLLSAYTALGATGQVNYQRYSGGSVSDTSTVASSGSTYVQAIISTKTRLRFELSAGQQLQDSSGAADTSNRYFYQALVSAEYLPTGKLSFDLGLGYGYQGGSDVIGRGSSGSRPVYRFMVRYVPTAKTTASFRFGSEGVDVVPDLQLLVNWEFRLNTVATLSVYQNSGFSTYAFNQNLITRGVLASVQQRFFGRLDVALSTGVEQYEGYGNNAGSTTNEDPYYFAGISLLCPINNYLAVQGYYRGYSGAYGTVASSQDGLQSRASVSLRLTF